MPAKQTLLALGRTERLALVDLFASLDEAQLTTPSLCDAWTVRDVLAHLATPLLVSNATIAKQLLRKPSFRAATVAWAEQVGQFTFDEQLDALRRSADAPFIPPGAGAVAPLTDAIVHGEDVRVPLGLHRDVPLDALRASLDFGTSLKAAPFFVPFRRLNGLRFAATDLDWSHGSGAAVEGPAQQVVLAVFGRVAAATDLQGDGVAVLAARCA